MLLCTIFHNAIDLPTDIGVVAFEVDVEDLEKNVEYFPGVDFFLRQLLALSVYFGATGDFSVLVGEVGMEEYDGVHSCSLCFKRE